MVTHKSFINCVEFAPLEEYMLATGSADQTIGIWDLRNMTQPISVLEGHSDEIFQLKFAPFSESILASCGSDRRVNVWDLSRIGDEQDPEELKDLRKARGKSIWEDLLEELRNSCSSHDGHGLCACAIFKSGFNHLPMSANICFHYCMFRIPTMYLAFIFRSLTTIIEFRLPI